MLESQFIRENSQDWKDLEVLLKKPHRDADKLNDLFVKVSSDLAYAKTHFPKRMVRVYLNDLTNQVFALIYHSKKKNELTSLKKWIRTTIPFEIKSAKSAFIVSLLVFVVSFAIGVFSAANDYAFVEQMLGPDYVEMTETNIANGDPMAVYKQSGKSDMFFGITTNNIRVAFFAFLLGILGGLGTIYILVFNGIMIGAFQYLFYSKGLLMTSFFTIWIHGTLEISAIIVAGAAGIVLGNSITMPKTYKRFTSFKLGAKKSLRILLTTVPLFIVAGGLESFVTRLTDLPLLLKGLIILTSFCIVLFIYVIYPYYLAEEEIEDNEKDLIWLAKGEHLREIAFVEQKSISQTFSDAISMTKKFFVGSSSRSLIYMMVGASVIMYTILHLMYDGTMMYFVSEELVRIVLAALIIFVLLTATKKLFPTGNNETLFSQKRMLLSLLCLTPYWVVFYAFPIKWSLLIAIVIPPQWGMILAYRWYNGSTFNNALVFSTFKESFNNWLVHFMMIFLCWLLLFIIPNLTNTIVFNPVVQLLDWHGLFNNADVLVIWLKGIMSIFISPVIIILMYYLHVFIYTSNKCNKSSLDLKIAFNHLFKS